MHDAVEQLIYHAAQKYWCGRAQHNLKGFNLLCQQKQTNKTNNNKQNRETKIVYRMISYS